MQLGFVRLESEVAVELPAEEGLHGGRAVAAQRGLLPLGRQLVESAPELAVESRQVNVVLRSLDGCGQSISEAQVLHSTNIAW